MIYKQIYNIIKQSFIFFSWNFPVTLIIQKKTYRNRHWYYLFKPLKILWVEIQQKLSNIPSIIHW